MNQEMLAWQGQNATPSLSRFVCYGNSERDLSISLILKREDAAWNDWTLRGT